jgi:hypothetical protein
MKTLVEDNTVAVLQKAISFLKIRVTKSGIKESLRSHPDYPTKKIVFDIQGTPTLFINDYRLPGY